MPIIAALKGPAAKGFRAVIVSPTRELAAQIKREFDRLAEGTKLQVRGWVGCGVGVQAGHRRQHLVYVCVGVNRLIYRVDNGNDRSDQEHNEHVYLAHLAHPARVALSHLPVSLAFLAHVAHIAHVALTPRFVPRCGCWTKARRLPTRSAKGLR